MRLIDAERLRDELEYRKGLTKDAKSITAYNYAILRIDSMPTIGGDALLDAPPNDISALVFFLSLYAPAPENAPKDWESHGDENLEAWESYLREAWARGYFAIPMEPEKAGAQE